MATLPADRESASSDQAKSDALTVIHGISPERASKFRDCGIDSLQVLAEISDAKAESVATKIKYVSAQMIKDWRAAAQERLSFPQVEEESRPKSEIDVEEREWRSIASFSVAFQSRQVGEQREQRRVQIAHRQGDGPRFFHDIESDKSWRWILDQLGPRAQPPAAPELSVQPEIARIRLFQPRHTKMPIEGSKPGELLSAALRADEPFALEASFTLTGLGAGDVAQGQRSCHARFYARNLPPGKSIRLGDAQFDASAQDEPVYKVHIPKASLPGGIYRLRVAVAVQGAGIASRYADGPILQVV